MIERWEVRRLIQRGCWNMIMVERVKGWRGRAGDGRGLAWGRVKGGKGMNVGSMEEEERGRVGEEERLQLMLCWRLWMHKDLLWAPRGRLRRPRFAERRLEEGYKKIMFDSLWVGNPTGKNVVWWCAKLAMRERWGGIQVFIEIRGGWLKDWNLKIGENLERPKMISVSLESWKLWNSKFRTPKIWGWNMRDSI